MTANKFAALMALYALVSAALTAYLWVEVGAFTAWMFCALACGLPQIVSAVKNI